MAALEKLSIDTPEQVALEFSLATVGSRFLAVAIDTVIQMAGASLLFLLAAAVSFVTGARVSAGPWVMAALVLGWFVIYSGYFAIFETVWNGQTPGKRVVGLRVIHVSGRPINAFEAILRNVVRIADQLPGVYAIGIVTIFLTERSQRLGDLAASTVVVHERTVGAEAPVVETRAARARPARHYGAARLSAAEVSLIELYFRRRDELDGAARIRMAQQIADRLRARLDISVPVEHEQFLEEILAEHRGGEW
ncbi:MAG TPA: RDD family protein [Vicinamibacterales bacterium]|nr:RDD family protein [Vicinamibacterales bacterium]